MNLPDCARPGCGHPANWHRIDDAANLGPCDPGVQFRCIGYDCTKPGPPQTCAGTCPDYAEPGAPQ